MELMGNISEIMTVDAIISLSVVRMIWIKLEHVQLVRQSNMILSADH